MRRAVLAASLLVCGAAHGEEPVALEGHARDATAVAFSPDGKTLATASLDGTVRLWDASGASLAALALYDGARPRAIEDEVYSVAFAPDGKQLAAGRRDGAIVLVDVANVASPAVARRLAPGGELASALVWGAELVAVDLRGVHVVDLATGKARRGVEADGVLAAAVAGKRVAVAQGRRVSVAELGGALQPVALDLEEGTSVRALAFAPGGKTLAIGASDKVVRLVDLETGKVVRTLEGPRAPVASLAFSPDGSTVVAGLVSTAAPGIQGLHAWETATGKKRPMPRAESFGAASVCFSPDGKKVAWISIRGPVIGTLP